RAPIARPGAETHARTRRHPRREAVDGSRSGTFGRDRHFPPRPARHTPIGPGADRGADHLHVPQRSNESWIADVTAFLQYDGRGQGGRRGNPAPARIAHEAAKATRRRREPLTSAASETRVPPV